MTIGFLVTSLTKALISWLLSLARRLALGRALVVPNFFHLRMMEANVLKIKNRNQLFKKVFRLFAMRHEIALRCILFTLIILEMFLQFDWSSPVVNSIDWTGFGKEHPCLYKVPQLTVHVRAKTKT